MKKLLGIVVLGLLWCGVGYTKEERLEKYKTLLKFRNIPFDADLFTWHNDDLH